jgi:hypothetical protein
MFNFIRFKLNRILRKIIFVPSYLIKKRILKYKDVYPEVMSIESTLDLLTSGYSLSRMGDGEYNLCFTQSIAFQKANFEIMQKLRFLLKTGRNDEIKYLVGIPRLKYSGKTFWGEFWFFHIVQISKLLNSKIIYGDLGISRHIELSHLDELKRIWHRKNVMFIYGKNSKFDVNHDIFKSINSKLILQSSNNNAFDEIQYISNEINKKKNSIDLILIALGPTASILAYDFCLKFKIQTIDIGHLTNVIDFKMKGISFKDGL